LIFSELLTNPIQRIKFYSFSESFIMYPVESQSRDLYFTVYPSHVWYFFGGRVNQLVLFCSLSFFAGMLVLWILCKTFNIFSQQEAQTRSELKQVRESFEAYQDQVNVHFSKASQLIEEIQQHMGHLQSHLFSSAQLLSQTPMEHYAEERADYAVAKAVLDHAQSAEFAHSHFLKKDA
jgi:uncharacterized membrane-anchored protein YhcB (DUF1043 family)